MDTPTKLILGFLVIVLFLYLMTKCSGRSNSDKVTVTYYSVATCPHCMRFTPEWNKFRESEKGKARFVKIDCTTNPDMCSNIRGVPTVVFTTNGSDMTYDGDRTQQSLSVFLTKLLRRGHSSQ